MSKPDNRGSVPLEASRSETIGPNRELVAANAQIENSDLGSAQFVRQPGQRVEVELGKLRAKELDLDSYGSTEVGAAGQAMRASIELVKNFNRSPSLAAIDGLMEDLRDTWRQLRPDRTGSDLDKIVAGIRRFLEDSKESDSEREQRLRAKIVDISTEMYEVRSVYENIAKQDIPPLLIKLEESAKNLEPLQDALQKRIGELEENVRLELKRRGKEAAENRDPSYNLGLDIQQILALDRKSTHLLDVSDQLQGSIEALTNFERELVKSVNQLRRSTIATAVIEPGSIN